MSGCVLSLDVKIGIRLSSWINYQNCWLSFRESFFSIENSSWLVVKQNIIWYDHPEKYKIHNSVFNSCWIKINGKILLLLHIKPIKEKKSLYNDKLLFVDTSYNKILGSLFKSY